MTEATVTQLRRRRRTVAELAEAMLDAPSGANNELAAELIAVAGGIDSARSALARARARREGHPVIYDGAADDLRPNVPLSVQLALSVVNGFVQASLPDSARLRALEAMTVVRSWLRGEHCDRPRRMEWSGRDNR